MKNLKLPSKGAMLFNAAAILVGGASLVVVLRSAFFAPSEPACSGRYAQGTRMQLDRDGVPLTAADLQARADNTDWGLIRGAQVVNLRSGPAQQALQIDLTDAQTAEAPVNADSRPGVGFIWEPQGLGRTQAACLAYSVFVPEGFSLGQGTRLPGLMGRGSSAVAGSEQASDAKFSVRYAWTADGDGDLYAELPDWPPQRPLGPRLDGFALGLGRWIRLEQEVVLNGPGLKDGILRAWVDGKLAFEKTNVVFRQKPSVLISGVEVEAVAGRQPPDARLSQQKLWITPFEVRWR